jgi:tetrahydromethanopterin S-methyltransferase subunit H
MFKFPRELKTVEIGNIRVGNDNPMLLIGTILYREEKKIRTINGIDFEEARRQIETAISLKEKPGFNFLLDVFFDKEDDFEKIINFVNEFNIPFAIDSEDWETRIKILKYCKETGQSKNVLYNSINYGMNEDEREEIKGLKPENAILLAYNPLDSSVKGKVDYVKNKLLPFSQNARIKNVLIDSGVVPIGAGSLNSIRAVIALKSELGYPTGSGIHNIASEWVHSLDKPVREICDSSLCACQALLGADFMLYGPIESSWRVFPVVKMISEILKDE